MKARRLLTLIIATIAVMAGLVLPAQGDERQDLVDKQKENAAKEQEIKSSLEGLDADLQSAFLVLEKTRQQIPGAEEQLAQAESELAASERKAQANAALLNSAQQELAGISGNISDSSAQAQDAKRALGEVARASYRGDSIPSAIDLILGSASAEEFTNAYRVNAALTRSQLAAFNELNQTVAQAKNRQSRQEAVEKRVAQLKAESDAIVVERNNARNLAQEHKTELLNLEASIDQQTKDLEGRKQDFETTLAAIDEQQKATAQRIAAIDEENRRREAERRAAAAAAAATAVPTGSGWLHPPIPFPHIVTSPFGMRDYPLGNYRAMHYGVDLAQACGNPQYAAAEGTIAYIVYDTFGGNIVAINHGIHNGSSYVTRHMHLSVVKVRVGQHVSQGEVIGLTGDTGRVTGCHVHFEVWKDGVAQNAMNLPGF